MAMVSAREASPREGEVETLGGLGENVWRGEDGGQTYRLTSHSGTRSALSLLFFGSFVMMISISIDSGPESVCFTVSPPHPYCRELVVVAASHDVVC
jgi:hypothetical protein